MSTIIGRTGSDLWALTEGEYVRIRQKIWGAILLSTAVFLGFNYCMWKINVKGNMFDNIIPFFVGILLIAMILSKTKVTAGLSLLGLAWALLNGESKLGGLRDGISWQLRLLWTVELVYAFSSFLLTTVPFAESPFSYWTLLICALMATIAYQYDKETKSRTWKIVTYPVIVIALFAAWIPFNSAVDMWLDVAEEKEVQTFNTPPTPPTTDAIVEKQTPAPDPTVCRGVFAEKDSCERITISSNKGYQTKFVPRGICPLTTNTDQVVWKEVGDREWEIYSRGSEITVHYYQLTRGEAFDGYTCT